MTAPHTLLVEKVAVAMWETWNRVMVEYGLHKQSNGGFYDPEPTDDPIKAEAHRLLRKAALDEAQAAIAACHAEEMREMLTQIASYPDANVISDAHYVVRKQARALLAEIDDQPTGDA